MDSNAVFDVLSHVEVIIALAGFLFGAIRYLNHHRAILKAVIPIVVCVGLGGASIALGIQGGTVSSDLSSRPLPELGLIALGAIAFSVLLGVINVFVTKAQATQGKHTLPQILNVELRMLLLEVLSILAIWLAYGTAVGRLPMSPPAPGAAISGISLLDGYRVVAVVAHGLFTIAVPFLFVLWRVQLFIPAKSTRATNLFLTVGTILMMVGWEYGHWPIAFVMLAEAVMMYPVANGTFQVLTGGYAEETTPAVATREQLKATLQSVLLMIGITLVLFLHESPFGWLNILGIYWVLISLDPIAAGLVAATKKSFSPLAPRGRFFTPERSFFTVPLAIIGVALGASGLYMPISNNLSITYQEWLLGGAPALAYLIIRPITDLAQLRILQYRLSQGLSKMRQTQQQAMGRALSRDSNGQASYPSSRPLQQQFHEIDAPDQDELNKMFDQAIQDSKRVTFPAAIVFLISTWIYGNLVSIPSLATLLTQSATPIVLCLLILLINASNGGLAEHLRPSAQASRVLSLVVVAVAIIMLILVNLPEARADVALAGRPPGELLQTPTFLLPMALGIVQELLVLLVIGSGIYLLRVFWGSSKGS